QQVAAWGQAQGNRGGGHAIEAAGNGIVVRTQADFRDVLHAHLRTVLVDLDQNLAEFFRGGQTGTADNRGVELGASVCGQPAQLPGGHLHVLLADGVGRVAGGQLKAIQFGRVQPDAHGILRAEQQEVTPPVNPRDRVLQIGGDVVTQVEVIHATALINQADDLHEV